jgi:hypothetical protein
MLEKIDRLKSYRILQVFVVYLRYLIGFSWVYASIVKIQSERFTSVDGIHAPINSAWHMFETFYQSGIYWNFIGWSQLFIGGLLLTQRFSLLGAVYGLPIAANIFVITLSYDFAGTPIITGLMLLGIMFLLLWDIQNLQVLLLPRDFTYSTPDKNAVINHKNWMYLGLVYFLGTILNKVYFNTHTGFFLFMGSFVFIGLLTLGITLQENPSSSPEG